MPASPSGLDYLDNGFRDCAINAKYFYIHIYIHVVCSIHICNCMRKLVFMLLSVARSPWICCCKTASAVRVRRIDKMGIRRGVEVYIES